MFTGIIEDVGRVLNAEVQDTNLKLSIESSFVSELKVDQSVAHNGVCLTVTDIIDNKFYEVVAVKETLAISNLGSLGINEHVNLERCMKLGSRLDGHLVQGHVDTIAKCLKKEDLSGSWEFTFSLESEASKLVVLKGSICINGVSLTVSKLTESSFSVAIIPYTYENTSFNKMKEGDMVNLEFDIIGKYILRNISNFH